MVQAACRTGIVYSSESAYQQQRGRRYSSMRVDERRKVESSGDKNEGKVQ